TLFITQRSLLLGMPLTIVVLGKLWEWFESEKTEESATPANHFSAFSRFPTSPFLVGLIAGMLPLVHLHSLAVLFVVTVFLFGLRPQNWRTWAAFGVGVAVIAIPELAWSITGSATHASEFFDWWFGWNKGDANIFWFWFKNTGLVIPLIAAGIYLFLRRSKNEEITADGNKLWLFYTPFLFCFIVSNIAKLAPWEWDNIKVLIYWFVGSLPFIAFALSWLWRKGSYFRVLVALCFLSLVLSGMLDV